MRTKITQSNLSQKIKWLDVKFSNMSHFACNACEIGIAKDGFALHNPDFCEKQSNGVTHVSNNALPAVLVHCLKCDECGHSWIPPVNKLW